MTVAVGDGDGETGVGGATAGGVTVAGNVGIGIDPVGVIDRDRDLATGNGGTGCVGLGLRCELISMIHFTAAAGPDRPVSSVVLRISKLWWQSWATHPSPHAAAAANRGFW